MPDSMGQRRRILSHSNPSDRWKRLCTASLSVVAVGALTAHLVPAAAVPSSPRNIVFILSDDHRYDFMSFHERAPKFLRTPNLDRMAREGVHLRNAFVTTSLCSPSRASILTGQYAHRHGVVDNQTAVPSGTRFFPADLQRQGYRTAFIGKWHMGDEDDHPRPGFDRWVSFRGQGVYNDPVFNVDGTHVAAHGYVTDVLTDYAIDWLKQDPGKEKPFFLYLSHKAIHAGFQPPPRYAGRYADVEFPHPASMANTEANARGKPRWVLEQRFGHHGVAFPYEREQGIDDLYRRYAETLLAVDDSVGRVLDYLDEAGLSGNTLVVYMGDNGFMFGEHGLIDKRCAYEPSIRVPMLAWAPGYIPAGSVVDDLVRNIDVAPTFLAVAGAQSSIPMDGTSVLGLLRGRPAGGSASVPASDREFLYEYNWEYAFPHTPTTFALRGDRYKFITYHGIWDIDELYDLRNDPDEMHNLIDVPAMQDTVESMRSRLYDRLEAAGAMSVPLRRGTWRDAERLLH